jgi:glutamine synthetase
MTSKRSVVQQTAKVSKSSGVPLALHAPRGVKTWKDAVDWLKIRGIEDIECITPDLAGVAR